MEYERVFEPELCNKPAAGDIDGSSALREVFSIGPIRAVHQVWHMMLMPREDD